MEHGHGESLELDALGPLRVTLSGQPVSVGTPKQRALLCALLVDRQRPRSMDELVDILWGDAPPKTAVGTVQAYLSGLRRALEPGREARGRSHVLGRIGSGYQLLVAEEATDVGRFSATVLREHEWLASIPLLAPPSVDPGRLVAAAAGFDAALATWRGRPYDELGDAPVAAAPRARLQELWLLAREDRALVGLLRGEHAHVAAELEELSAQHPLREHVWALFAVALARSNRQGDALAALARVRAVLADELGLDPGTELREVQAAILQQDPALDPPGSIPGVVAAAPRDPVAASVRRQPWPPLVGRSTEFEALSALLEGGPGVVGAIVVGEPGIGKTRLLQELDWAAEESGWRVVVGRCTSAEGAPSLWPWSMVLGRLGVDLAGLAGDAAGTTEAGAGAQFRVWDRIVRAVRDAAGQGPLLVVLEDLHWTDDATAHVLQLLLEDDCPGLVVVGTRWARPAPSPALADAEVVGHRRGLVRVELGGLDAGDCVSVVEEVIGASVPSGLAGALAQRTDGNPFFLIEYARLAQGSADLGELLADSAPPTVVQAVVGRRFDRLPDSTREVLRTAAVIGHRFEAEVLAAATGLVEEALLDAVGPALHAGMVLEEGAGRYAFAHGLVRDTVYATLRPTQRIRRHAAVATALGSTDGHPVRRAWHWLKAGPEHAGIAWRSAAAAAGAVARQHAHDEAIRLLQAALDRLEDDPHGTDEDRYDLLTQLVESDRWGGGWEVMMADVRRLVEVAERLGAPDRLARAAISMTEGVLWRAAPMGTVNEVVVAALRTSLASLPPGDSELRCRAELALVNEQDMYTQTDSAARVADAVAMAERIGDPLLLMHAHQVAFRVLWSVETLHERLVQITAAEELARAAGHEYGRLVSAVLRCVTLSELGRRGELFAAAEPLLDEAIRLRIQYGASVLQSLLVQWLAMAGRFDECEARVAAVDGASRLSADHSGDATQEMMWSLRLWQGREAEMLPTFLRVAAGPEPLRAGAASFLWRAGEHERARDMWQRTPPSLEAGRISSLFDWRHAAEMALYVGDEEVAHRVYELMLPYAGLGVQVGSALASGPVDVGLALAAATCGDRALAARHAADARELCERWQIPLAARQLEDWRSEYRF